MVFDLVDQLHAKDTVFEGIEVNLWLVATVFNFAEIFLPLSNVLYCFASNLRLPALENIG